MATLKLTNPLGAMYLPFLGREVAAGEKFDCPDELVPALLAQLGNYEWADKGKPPAPNDPPGDVTPVGEPAPETSEAPAADIPADTPKEG